MCSDEQVGTAEVFIHVHLISVKVVKLVTLWHYHLHVEGDCRNM